jgi:hypothetical protein
LRPTQDRCEVPLSALVRPVKSRGAKANGALKVLSLDIAADHKLIRGRVRISATGEERHCVG